MKMKQFLPVTITVPVIINCSYGHYNVQSLFKYNLSLKENKTRQTTVSYPYAEVQPIIYCPWCSTLELITGRSLRW